VSEPLNLIQRLLSSEAKAELLILFHKNPGLIDTLEGIARRVGRSGKVIESEIKDLLDVGILRLKKLGQSEVISLNYSKDKEVQGVISKYMEQQKASGGSL